MIERPRIIDVVRKPRKCPVCGERVVDIIYGTGDMTEIDYRETDLYLPTAFESLRIIAEALSNENVAKGAVVDYWLNEKKVNRFH